MSRRISTSCVLTIGSLVALVAGAIAEQGGQQGNITAPYSKLDKIEDAWVNRNPVPYRPMVALNGVIWACNPYLSEVVRVGTSSDVARFRTLPGPVSIATYQPTPGVNRLLVVCQHANAVAIHDPATGDMLDAFPVRAQPADIVVDQFNHAWVSCALADVVLEHDLTPTALPDKTYSVNSKSPGFLTLYGNEVLVAPRVSGNGTTVDRKESPPPPTMDFNNFAGPRGIRNTLDASILDPTFPNNGLPDQDLFWLNRSTVTAVAIARSTGTLLFQHATQPGTTTLWQLNLDARNLASQSESGFDGDIVRNRITRIPLPAPTPPWTSAPSLFTPAATDIETLDDMDPLTQTIDFPTAGQLGRMIGTPYALAFDTVRNRCYIAGLMTDNVVGIDLTTGHRVSGPAIPLPAGTMPRQLLMDATQDNLAIWGSDCTVHLFNLNTLTINHISLGFDPTPAAIQAGRKLFFDAGHSKHNNASCASCHDEGKTDMLAWNLSKVTSTGDGYDNKGPMVTQTLLNINRALPFHWRGEQLNGLPDFNPAFAGLLGGTPLSDPEFAQFQAYVFSLTEDANQFQNKKRVLDSDIRPSSMSSGDAIAGQTKFVEPGVCSRCHALPSGTSNEIVDNSFEAETMNRRVNLKIAPFQGLQSKAMQTNVPIMYASGQGNPQLQTLPLMGTGLAHAGTVTDLPPFMEEMLPGTSNAAARANVACFLFQFDTGMAPAAHSFVLMRSTNANAAKLTVNSYLLNQASATNRNCDVAVIGREAAVGSPVRGWIYDRLTLNFEPDDVDDVPRSLDYFKTQALSGGWFAFVGLPVGTARKFAIDFDLDELRNGDETATSQFTPDTDGDGFWDGIERRTGADPFTSGYSPTTADTTPPALVPAGSRPNLQWVTQRTARLTFATNELTVAQLILQPQTGVPGATTITLEETTPKMQHDFLVNSLRMPEVYRATLKLVDLAAPFPTTLTFASFGGNAAADIVSTTPAIPKVDTFEDFVTGPAVMSASSRVIRSLAWSPGSPTGGSGQFTFTATGFVTLRESSSSTPVGNERVIARPLINGVPANSAQFPLAISDPLETQFQVAGRPYVPSIFFPNPTLGPFAIAQAPSASLDGKFTFVFTLTGLSSGDKVTLSIEATGPGLPPVGSDHYNIDGNSPDLRFSPIRMPSYWSFPDTEEASRRIDFTIP